MGKKFLLILLSLGAVVALMVVVLPSRAAQLTPEEITKLQSELPEITDGMQRVAVTAGNEGYFPDRLVLHKGVPVELKVFGHTYGCAATMVSRELWGGVQQISYGEDNLVHFTPKEAGKYKFSCSMGMYVGNVFVI